MAISFTSALYCGFVLAGKRWGRVNVIFYFLLFSSIVAFSLSVAAYRRNLVWRDGYTLWKDTALKSPNKARPHSNLGLAYYDRGLLDDAIREYTLALKFAPKLS